jgi:hypothetical protein
MKAPTTTRTRTTPEQPSVHTPLTLADVDTINACRLRLLNAAVLLELGLNHMDDVADVAPECIQDALLDVVERLREDTTLIATTIQLAGDAR